MPNAECNGTGHSLRKKEPMMNYIPAIESLTSYTSTSLPSSSWPAINPPLDAPYVNCKSGGLIHEFMFLPNMHQG